MNYYAGIDVSLEYSSVCVVDASGNIVREAKVASEPEALIGWFVEQSQGGAGAQTRRDHAAHAQGQHAVQGGRHGGLSQEDEQVFGRVKAPALPKRSPDRRDDGSGQAATRVVDALNNAITLS